MKIVMVQFRQDKNNFTYNKKIIILNNVLHLMRHIQNMKIEHYNNNWIPNLQRLCNNRIYGGWWWNYLSLLFMDTNVSIIIYILLEGNGKHQWIPGQNYYIKCV